MAEAVSIGDIGNPNAEDPVLRDRRSGCPTCSLLRLRPWSSCWKATSTSSGPAPGVSGRTDGSTYATRSGTGRSPAEHREPCRCCPLNRVIDRSNSHAGLPLLGPATPRNTPDDPDPGRRHRDIPHPTWRARFVDVPLWRGSARRSRRLRRAGSFDLHEHLALDLQPARTFVRGSGIDPPTTPSSAPLTVGYRRRSAMRASACSRSRATPAAGSTQRTPHGLPSASRTGTDGSGESRLPRRHAHALRHHEFHEGGVAPAAARRAGTHPDPPDPSRRDGGGVRERRPQSRPRRA